MTDAPADVDGLIDGARAGQVRALARLITLVENSPPTRRAVSAALAAAAPRAAVVGITGPPGAGKSTLTSALVAGWRAAGRRVGVLAVDPSSPLSGGALLGDRIRMQDHAGDPGVFVRSLASRGYHGGLTAAVPLAARALDAAGCDVIVIETVGVGQAEFEIVALADTTVLVLVPGLGDGIQAAKAGILEVADVLVVNKADLPGADRVARELRQAQALGAAASIAGAWAVPVLPSVASTGEGVAALGAAIADHGRWLAESGQVEARRLARNRAEVEAITLDLVRARLAADPGALALDDSAARVSAGQVDPYTAADELLAGL